MNHLWRDSPLKRALFGAMLAVYLSASLGILPSPDLLSRWLGHAISEPFPCQSHSCGCATAHQCWTDCCCFTPRQRLAWAMRNRVTPPPSAHFSDADRLAAASDVAQDKAPPASDSADCPLCITDTKIEPNESARVPSVPAESPSGDEAELMLCEGHVTSDTTCCTTSSPALPLAECEVPPSLPLPSISPLTCKGLKLLLAFALPAAPPRAFASLLPPPPRLPRHDRPEDDRAPTRTLDTSEPPPRARTFQG